MNIKNLIEPGYKNKVYLLKNFHIDKKQISSYLKRINLKCSTTPLIQLSIFKPILNNTSLASVFENFSRDYKLNKTGSDQFSKNQLDRILVIDSNINQNSRRDVQINKKRGAILQFFNRKSKKDHFYQLNLCKNIQFIPDQVILAHLQTVFNYKNLQFERNQWDVTKDKNIKNSTYQSIFDVLFPFDLDKWSIYVKTRLRREKYFHLTDLQNSIMSMQIYNAYKIQFSKNKEWMYQDLKNMAKMFNKFNFFRYFATLYNSQKERIKTCQNLIKSIEWKTSQTEQYLLFLIRNQILERFQLVINNFIDLYQKKFNIKPLNETKVDFKPYVNEKYNKRKKIN